MRWTPAEDQVLAEMVEKGMTFKAIAEHFDDSREAVRGRARRLNLRPKRGRPNYAEVERDAHWAVPYRPYRTWSPEQDAFIRRRVAEGANYHAIAREMGVSPATVSARGFNIGIRREAEPERTRVDRWNCGHCATRSDAPLAFGCAKCLPLRGEAA